MLHLRFLISLALTSLFFFACESNNSHSMQDQDLTPPELPAWATSAVLYELNVRQFSEEGNFQAVIKELPRIKELGVDILWLMPIFPIGKENRKGTLGSPYSVQDYYAINPDYGDEEDLKQLVEVAHSLGLRVLLDWVPNHTAWDAVWSKNHPEYYTLYEGKRTVPLNEHGEPIEDWSDVCDLDYSKPELRTAMINAMSHWVKLADIDGFRVDMAGLVPNEFWKEARPALDSLKPLYMLAEWQDEPGHFQSCFHTNYGWMWKDVTKAIWKGDQNANALDSLDATLQKLYPKHFTQLYFTQNHDENTWAGTEADLYGASSDAFNVLSFTWAGMPLIYNGQEDILVQQLGFFNHTPIQWKNYAKTPFYQSLSALRHGNKALWSGVHGGKPVRIHTDADDAVYAFYREKEEDKVVVILNLSQDVQTFTMKIPESLTGPYANVFGKSTTQLTEELTLNLKPWEYIVLTNR
jgi:glycosidase